MPALGNRKRQNTHGSKDARTSSHRNAVLHIAVTMLLLIGTCGCGYVVWEQYHEFESLQRMQDAEVPKNPVVTEEELPDNPVDFSALWGKNVESYAWLYIPGVEINLPVQQSALDDSFYLDHDQNRNYNPVGCAFTQLANAQDFSDPVTVIYGHNVDGVFAKLHYFEDKEFFNQNDTFYVYTPGHILTYEVVAAYQYDDRHILNSFDFDRPSVRADYFSSVLNSNSVVCNVREGAKLDEDSKLVQLSTCVSTGSHSQAVRYIVTGVLVDDQETK